MTVRDRVLATVAQVMNVPLAELSDQSSPDTVAAWDSLQHMNLVLALEEQFGVRFSDDQVMTLLTVGAIVAALDGLGSGGNDARRS
jgi:acyl carrier protein